MLIQKVTDESFRKYGQVVKGIDFTQLCQVLNEQTPLPQDVAYEPSVDVLEALPVKDEIQTRCWGEMPIQIGYCNGHNVLLNAAEYHRNSEINVAATDAVLILGMQQDITDDFTYDTSRMEAFLVPAGTAVEIYATTLHYAPCGPENKGFKVGIILSKGTNYPLEKKHEGSGEDRLITAVNKWLIAHPEGGQDPAAHVGLIGKNLNILE